MHCDFLIIGQGISGTWLSYYLQKAGKSFLVIDNNDGKAPSRISAGIINPVTGRRHVTVWMAGELLPFAWNAYTELGKDLGIEAIHKRTIVDFFPSVQMRQSFMARVEEGGEFLRLDEEKQGDFPQFNYELGYGKIDPVYTVELDSLLSSWRNRLRKENRIYEEVFSHQQLVIEKNGITYKDVSAGKLIFCDGPGSENQPWFGNLPFAPNKGEYLLAEIDGIPRDHIYKRGLVIAPVGMGNLWWIGSNYAWEYADPLPTQRFREETGIILNKWLRVPFKITGHGAGIRPATLERRPFVGLHPHFPQLGMLNGMGTKGCSLAPYFAKQLADHLLSGKAISPEADIRRFEKLLAR